MKIKELRRLSKEELIKMKQELEFNLLSCDKNLPHPLIKPEKKHSVKRMIAQINILLTEK